MIKQISHKKLVGTMVLFILIAITACEDSVDSQIAKNVIELNESCPFLTGAADFTMLDSVKALPKRGIKYFHTLTITRSDIHASDIARKKKQMAQEISESTREMTVYYKSNNVTMIYAYYDPYGNLITEIEITPEDYK